MVRPRSDSQITMDILAFSKNCSRLASYLEEEEFDHDIVSGQLSSILFFLKKLIANKSFEAAAGPGSYQNLIEVVKFIRDFEGKSTFLKPDVKALADYLLPLSKNVKQTALDLYRSSNSPEADRKSQKSSELSRSSSRADSPLPTEEKAPIGYSHEFSNLKLKDDSQVNLVENDEPKASTNHDNHSNNRPSHSLSSITEQSDPKDKSAEPETRKSPSRFQLFGKGNSSSMKDLGSAGSSDQLGIKKSNSIGSSLTLGRIKSPKGSKFSLFSGSQDSIKQKKNKIESSESKLLVDKFENFIPELLSKGFKQDSDDIVSLSVDEKVILVIKIEAGIPRISSATLDKVLHACMYDEPMTDPKFIEMFFVTYRHYMSADHLLDNLIARYKNAAVKEKIQEIAQMQVSMCIQKWVSVSWEDFVRDEELKTRLMGFIDLIKSTKKVSLMAQQILNIIEQKEKAAMDVQNRLDEHLVNTSTMITDIGIAKFLDFDPIIFAHQMTCIDYKLYKNLTPVDLVDYLWKKKQTPASVEAWISRFNSVSYWVGTELCTTPLLKSRIKVLEHFIKVLKALKELNNFNAVMAVISGLNMASVTRLKKTWGGASGKLINQLHEIEKIMDPKLNYQVYREYEYKHHKQPFIPFLGIYLKDLTFANDGNPQYLDNGMLNISKGWAIFDVLERALYFQKNECIAEADSSAYDYCKKLISLPEKRLYSYSLLCEPRIDSGKSSAPNATDSIRLIDKWAK